MPEHPKSQKSDEQPIQCCFVGCPSRKIYMVRHLVSMHGVPKESATILVQNMQDLNSIELEDPTNLLPSSNKESIDLEKLLKEISTMKFNCLTDNPGTSMQFYSSQHPHLPRPSVKHSASTVVKKVAMKKKSLRQRELETRRFCSKCPLKSCDKQVVVAAKIRAHIFKSHKNLNAAERSAALVSMKNSIKLCDLTAPVGQGGKKLKYLLMKKNAFDKKGVPTSDIV